MVYCLFLGAMVLLVNTTSSDPASVHANKEQLAVAVALLKAIGSTWRAA